MRTADPDIEDASPTDAGPPYDVAYEGRRDLGMLKALNYAFCQGWHDVRVLRPPQVPRRGPVLLAINHISGLDPAAVQSALNRPVVWMMTHEFYDRPAMGWFFRRLEAIRVDRTQRDTSAVKAALRGLQAGRVVGIFPEGGIETEPHLKPLQPGAMTLAQRAGVPVHPVWIEGTMRNTGMLGAYLKPNRVTLAFGGPIPPDPARRPDIDALTDRLRVALTALSRLRS